MNGLRRKTYGAPAKDIDVPGEPMNNLHCERSLRAPGDEHEKEHRQKELDSRDRLSKIWHELILP
jgi:hypothetical protein